MKMVCGVVYLATTLTNAVPDVAAWNLLQHEREILRGHDQRRLAINLLGTYQFRADLRRRLGLTRIILVVEESAEIYFCGDPKASVGRCAVRRIDVSTRLMISRKNERTVPPSVAV